MSLNIKENIELKEYTTFKIGGPARYFVEVNSTEDLEQAVSFAQDKNLEIFVLGDGSNLVISDNGFPGLVIRVLNQGMEIIEETDKDVLVKYGSGEVWDEVVQYAVDKGYWGIENMSYIPGLIGASAVFNILAYGQQLSDVLEYVEAYDMKDKSMVKINKEDCGFGYKKSIFNTNAQGRYIILYAVIRLKRDGQPIIKYPDVKNYFEERGISEPSIGQMREALINIRVKKFGHWDEVGSAGSFFANLVLNTEQFKNLQHKIAEFADEDILQEMDKIKDKFVDSEYGKMPVAFILDKVLQLKGTQVGGAKLSERQGNAIINEKWNATAKDVMELFKKIRQITHEKTGLIVKNEPELIGFTPEELDNYFAI